MAISVSLIENTVLDLLPAFLYEAFPLNGFINAVTDKLNVPEGDDKRRVQKETELILANDERLFYTTELCYPREVFFRKTQFRIIPGRNEIKQNILLPGARFAPFASEEHFYDEFKVTSTDGIRCPAKTVTMKFTDMTSAFFLLGRAGMLDTLCAESDANFRKLRESSNIEHELLESTAFDMTEFYAKHNFRYGDAIIATVESWQDGIFTIAYQSMDQAPAKDAREAYLQRLEAALLDVCDDERDPVELPLQLSFAFLKAYLRKEDLRYTPDFSLDEYSSNMFEIAIRKEGPDWTFVSADSVVDPGMGNMKEAEEPEKSDIYADDDDDETEAAAAPEHSCSCGCDHDHEHDHHNCQCGHDHDHEHCHCGHHDHEDAAEEMENDEDTPIEIHPEDFSASSGTLESLDAILVERNAPLDPVEVHSYLLDALANGVENFADFRASIESILGITFADEAQEATFLNYLEDDWEISGEYFNPSFEADKEPYRRRLLDLCEQRVDLSVQLLQKFKNEVPKNLARPLARFHRNVCETLAVFCSDAPLPEEDDLEQLELRIDDLESEWEELSDRLNDALEQE